MEKTLREQFARFIVSTRCDHLPGEVIHMAKQCLMDFLGVAIAGSDVGLAPIVREVICRSLGNAEATIIGDGRKVPAFSAALLNGISGHTLDLDDGHRYANAHPGIVVIPAALALGEANATDGKTLIESIVAGYEVLLRIGSAMNPSHLLRGFHTTGTIGPFGAAAACCKILGLNKKQTENALSIAGLKGAGLLEVETSGQMMKPVHAGNAAQAGLMASLLAREGAEGPELIFEGQKGFLKAYSDLEVFPEIADTLGERFDMLSTYFKRYAACRHTHSALDAALHLMTAYEIDPEEIIKIVVHTYSVAYWLTGENRNPEDALSAKFSLPVSVALIVTYGRAGSDIYSMKYIKNPMVSQIADKVEVVVDPKRDAVYPSKRGACVTMETSKGTYTKKVDLPVGEPENPLSPEALKKKFLIHAGKVLSPENIDCLYEMILKIEHISLPELMRYVY